MRCPRCNFNGEPLDGGCARCGYGRSIRAASSASLQGREVVASGPVGLIVRPVIRGDTLRQGRYRVVEQIKLPRNQQGQGKAWLANDAQALNRTVMIREVIPAQNKAGQGFEQEMRTLAQRLATLGQYPGFPHLLDMFTERGNYYLVFQQPEGETLARFVEQRGGSLPERLVIDYGRQLCEMLQVMASQQPPLVHGAINPETVIVSPDGQQITLIYFPLFPPEMPAELRGKTVAGYLAPEQLNGVTDERTDIYCVAVTLYHALTGYDPEQHMAFFYPPVRRLNSRVSQRMEAILARGLRVASSQRYARPAEMLQDLRDLYLSYPARGREPELESAPPLLNGTHKPRQSSGSSKTMVLSFTLVTILVVALLIGGIALATMRGPVNAGPDPAATATANAQQTAIALKAKQAYAASKAELTLETQTMQRQGIAVSDGRFVFDIYSGRKDVTQKQQAAQAIQATDFDTAASSLQAAINADPTDAEARIYNENLQIVQNGLPSVSIVLGMGFDSANPEALAAERAMLQAAFVAQYEINEFGWLPHGLQLRLLIAGSPPDSASAATAAQFVANRVIKADNLDAIIGVVGWPLSAQTSKARDVIMAAHIPVISQLSPDVNLGGNPYFFRVSPPYDLQANALAEFAQQRLHAKSVLLLSSPADPASTALANAFAARAQTQQLKVIQNARDTFTPMTTTALGYQQAISDAVASGANVIVLPGSDVDAVRLAHEIGQLSRLRPDDTALANLKVLAGPGAATRLLLGQGDSQDALIARAFPQDMQRINCIAYADPSEWQKVSQVDRPTLFTDWAGLFQNQVPRNGVAPDNAPPPDQNAIVTYDAVRVIAKAATYVKGALTGAALRDVLDALGSSNAMPAFQGASGLISFDALGNPSDKAVPVLAVQQVKGSNANQFSTVEIFGKLH